MGIKAEMTTIDATCGDSSNRLVLQTQCLQGNKGTQKTTAHIFSIMSSHYIYIFLNYLVDDTFIATYYIIRRSTSNISGMYVCYTGIYNVSINIIIITSSNRTNF